MTENKRLSDTLSAKIGNLWQLIVALISLVIMATTIKNKVDDHETRLSRLENSMINIKINTDRLVDELLDKR